MGDYFFYVFLVSLALFTNNNPQFLPVKWNCDDDLVTILALFNANYSNDRLS
jgi:hypothetical protein